MIGMHTEGVNHWRDRKRQAVLMGGRLSPLEHSLDTAIGSVAQGAVALLLGTLFNIT